MCRQPPCPAPTPHDLCVEQSGRHMTRFPIRPFPPVGHYAKCSSHTGSSLSFHLGHLTFILIRWGQDKFGSHGGQAWEWVRATQSQLASKLLLDAPGGEELLAPRWQWKARRGTGRKLQARGLRGHSSLIRKCLGLSWVVCRAGLCIRCRGCDTRGPNTLRSPPKCHRLF